MDLKGKVVVITGAASGLGRAMAIEFFGRGCHLALIDIDRDGLRSIKSHFGRSEQRVTIHEADITHEKQIIAARDEITDRHRQVNILINNAGISISQEFVDVRLEDYQSLMNVNFWGTVFCTKYFLPSLKQQSNSRLVNIISDFALMGFPGKTAYASSKGAVMSFTNALKTELTETSVKVCLVIPPPLDTGLIKNSLHVNEHKRNLETAFVRDNGVRLDKAAKTIVSEIKNGKFRVVVGTMMFWIDLLSRLFPTAIHHIIGKNKKRIDFV